MTDYTDDDYIKMVGDDEVVIDPKVEEVIEPEVPEEVEEIKEEVKTDIESAAKSAVEIEEALDPNIEIIAQLREENAVSAERLRVAEELAKASIETDARTDYQKAIDSVELSKEQQEKFNDYEELDEDQAKLYKDGIRRDKVLESIMGVQKAQKVKEEEYHIELERQEVERQAQLKIKYQQESDDYNEVISKNKNLFAWQADSNEWPEVNAMHTRLLKNKDYQQLSVEKQMDQLESRYAKFIGLEPEEPKEAPNADKIIEEVEAKKSIPSSISSFSGGDKSGNAGKLVITEDSTGPELQAIMDKLALSDDPEAITKFLSGDGV